MGNKTYFNWSTGKDAAFALYLLQKNHNFQVDRLLTTINGHHNRVSMHGLRKELLIKQIEELCLPLTLLELPENPSMEQYDQLMSRTVQQLQKDGFTYAGFGDIFLEDLRKYREDQLQTLGVQCCFPLWKKDTKNLIKEFLDLGFRAIVVCVKADLLSKNFVGREIDEDFIKDLPDNVDPCGENGEFHTFCFDGPIFNKPISFSIGEKIYREYVLKKDEEQPGDTTSLGFWFCDLLQEE